MIKFIEKIVISDKIGFDELSEIEQYILIELSAEISNRIKDLDDKGNIKANLYSYEEGIGIGAKKHWKQSEIIFKINK